jgi:hypothetical protein
MKAQPDNICDMVLGSPPYEKARTYGINFDLEGQDWVDWMVPRVVEMCRVTDGLVFLVMAGRRVNWKYQPVVEWLVADLTRQHGIVCGPAPYVYHRVGVPGSGSGKYSRRDWEPVYAFAQPEKAPPKWTDNTALGHAPRWAVGGAMSNRLSDGTRRNQWGGNGGPAHTANRRKDGSRESAGRPSHRMTTKRIGRRRQGGGVIEEQSYVAPAIADPGNLITGPWDLADLNDLLDAYESSDVRSGSVGGGQIGDKIAHENEAPFPEWLAEFFVLSYCPPGGTVLDPFCGSGTTMAVAKRHRRGYIGVDLRQSQIELSKKRLAEVQVSLF